VHGTVAQANERLERQPPASPCPAAPPPQGDPRARQREAPQRPPTSRRGWAEAVARLRAAPASRRADPLEESRSRCWPVWRCGRALSRHAARPRSRCRDHTAAPRAASRSACKPARSRPDAAAALTSSALGLVGQRGGRAAAQATMRVAVDHGAPPESSSGNLYGRAVHVHPALVVGHHRRA